MSSRNDERSTILTPEKKTHVLLSYDWGIDGSNHQRVKQISDALKSRGLKTWIDDERIVNDIDRKIVDGINHTECMTVFLTENYVSKVDGRNDKDYCKREFNYGFEKLGKDKILVVVLDESLKDSSRWGSTIPFNLGSVLYVDMTETSSSHNSMNDLYQRILKIVFPERMVVESKTPVEDSEVSASPLVIHKADNVHHLMIETLSDPCIDNNLHIDRLLVLVKENSTINYNNESDQTYHEREFDRSVKLLRRRNPVSKNLEDQMEEKERIPATAEITELMNDMGMLMWIEEKDLEDFIILDPIEYLVKPATTLISKYLSESKKLGELGLNDIWAGYYPHLSDAGVVIKTNHKAMRGIETIELHRANNQEDSEDRMMLEFGRLSEMAVHNIWAGYYPHLSDAGVTVNSKYNIDNDLLTMIRFGLMFLPPITSLDNTGSSGGSNNRYIPSLLPSDSPTDNGGNNDGFENNKDGDDSKDSRKQKISLMAMMKSQPDESWNTGMYFSLFFFPFMEGFPCSQCLEYDVISSYEIKDYGFLHPALFERFIYLFKDRLGGFQYKNGIDNNCAKASFTFALLEICIVERRDEKRIEVIFRSHPNADKLKEKKAFQDIYYIMIYVLDDIRKEFNIGWLQVKTLIHPPPGNTGSCNFISEDVLGCITLSKERQLLKTPPGSSIYDQFSCDSRFSIRLHLESMKRDPYWIVWEEKINIIPFLASASSSALPLKAGKKTHVFLSHDWGIDDNNHHRVKQINEALKSRGLKTWIDDEKIVNDIDRKIIDGIDHTECMIVFLTENYVSKVDGWNDKDYCQREFRYGFKKLGKAKIILISLDAAMKNSNKWGGFISFNLSEVICSDLSMIFEASSSQSNDENVAKLAMDNLFQRIISFVEDIPPSLTHQEVPSALFKPKRFLYPIIFAFTTIIVYEQIKKTMMTLIHNYFPFTKFWK